MSDALNTAFARSIADTRAIMLDQYAGALDYFEARAESMDGSLSTRLSELRSMVDNATDDQLDAIIGEAQTSHEVYESLRDELEVFLETVAVLKASL